MTTFCWKPLSKFRKFSHSQNILVTLMIIYFTVKINGRSHAHCMMAMCTKYSVSEMRTRSIYKYSIYVRPAIGRKQLDLVNKSIFPTKLIIMARWPALRKWEETVLAYTCTLASSLKFGRGLGTKLTYHLC